MVAHGPDARSLSKPTEITLRLLRSWGYNLPTLQTSITRSAIVSIIPIKCHDCDTCWKFSCGTLCVWWCSDHFLRVKELSPELTKFIFQVSFECLGISFIFNPTLNNYTYKCILISYFTAYKYSEIYKYIYLYK